MDKPTPPRRRDVRVMRRLVAKRRPTVLADDIAWPCDREVEPQRPVADEHVPQQPRLS